LAGLAAAPAASPAAAPRPEVDGDAEVRESLYIDDDHTWVSTTRADGTIAPEPVPLTFRAGYVADVISSASIDVVSAATGRFREVRHEGGSGIEITPGLWEIDLGYSYSNEPDFRSHGASASLGRDFFMRNTNVAVGYLFSHGRISRVGDDDFEEKLLTGATTLTYTQVLDPKTTSRVTGFFAALGGHQSSPYRYVPVGNVGVDVEDPADRCIVAVTCPLERHPTERFRYALMATLARHVGRARPAALRGSYRFYGDSWEIISHAFELGYRVDLVRRLQLRAQSRTYFQGKAFFYQPEYPQELTYVSVDRELSTFIHQLTGLKLTFKSGLLGEVDDLRIDVKGDLSYFHFFDFRWLPQRLGGVVEVGLRVVF
jgi:hypothetical protein